MKRWKVVVIVSILPLLVFTLFLSNKIVYFSEVLNEEPYAGNPQVRFREGSVFNPIMEQILWHSQRKRRETVKTNLLLKLERHTFT